MIDPITKLGEIEPGNACESGALGSAVFAFHHHGLALQDDADALLVLRLLGYTVGAVVHDPLQDVRLRLCTHSTMPAIEIVMPGDRPGPLDGVLRRHAQLIYHTCYEVADREAALAALEEAGVRLIEVLPPVPAVLFDGRKVSFHTAMGFGLIELLDRQ